MCTDAAQQLSNALAQINISHELEDRTVSYSPIDSEIVNSIWHDLVIVKAGWRVQSFENQAKKSLFAGVLKDLGVSFKNDPCEPRKLLYHPANEREAMDIFREHQRMEPNYNHAYVFQSRETAVKFIEFLREQSIQYKFIEGVGEHTLWWMVNDVQRKKVVKEQLEAYLSAP